jgi:hypothetical protein
LDFGMGTDRADAKDAKSPTKAREAGVLMEDEWFALIGER